jgi:hypothetical protein
VEPPSQRIHRGDAPWLHVVSRVLFWVGADTSAQFPSAGPNAGTMQPVATRPTRYDCLNARGVRPVQRRNDRLNAAGSEY